MPLNEEPDMVEKGFAFSQRRGKNGRWRSCRWRWRGRAKILPEAVSETKKGAGSS
jgi:hypothetical protein